VHDVGIYAMLQCQASNGSTRSGACTGSLQFELGAVKQSLGRLGSASFARRGVHGVHHAHYLNLSAAIQGVMDGRLPRKAAAGICKLRFEAFGCADMGSNFKPIHLDVMAGRYI
jgi:hypothetical protein